MTPEIIKEFLVSIGFDVDDTSYAQAMVSAGALAAAVGATIIGVARQVQNFVDDAARDLDSLAGFSRRIKEDAGFVEKFEYAATILDSTAEAARSSLENLAEQIGRAANKMPRALKLFERLGLEWKHANGQIKTGKELLGDISERLAKMESREKQLAFLSSLGIDPTLLRTLTEDWSALADELDRVNKATGLTKQQAADLGSEYETASRRLGKIVDSVYKAIALRLMPRMIEEMKKLRAWLVDKLPEILERVEPVLNFVLDAAKVAFDMILRAGEAARDAYKYYQEWDEATGGLLTKFLLFKLAWAAWNSELAQSETGTLLKMGALFLLLYDDYKTFKEGGISAIDWDGWFGKGLLWLGEFYANWKVTGMIIGVVLDALWEVAKFLIVLAASAWFFGWLSKVTAGIRFLGTAMKALFFLSFADDIFYVAVAIGFLLYYFGLLDWNNWKAAMFGWSKLPFLLKHWFGQAMNAVVEWATNSANFVMEKWEGVKKWFSDWFTWLVDNMPDLPGIDIFSGSASPATVPALVPSPAQQAVMFGTGSNVSQETNINVYGDNAPAIGREVAGHQKSVNAGLVRDTYGASR